MSGRKRTTRGFYRLNLIFSATIQSEASHRRRLNQRPKKPQSHHSSITVLLHHITPSSHYSSITLLLHLYISSSSPRKSPVNFAPSLDSHQVPVTLSLFHNTHNLRKPFLPSLIMDSAGILAQVSRHEEEPYMHPAARSPYHQQCSLYTMYISPQLRVSSL